MTYGVTCQIMLNQKFFVNSRNGVNFQVMLNRIVIKQDLPVFVLTVYLIHQDILFIWVVHHSA